MISWTTVVIVAVICLACEAFFSGSEIALVSANKTRLRQRAQAGERGARLAEAFLRQPQVLLATTLLGTNLALVTISVTVALALMGPNSLTREFLAVVTVTPMTLLFGEVVPKTLCRRHADVIVSRIVYPLQLASVVLRPGVWVVSGFAGVITKLFGVARQRAFVTRDELSLLIESEASGSSDITEGEREMIANVLELSESSVDDVMVPLSEVTALCSTTEIAVVAAEIADKQHSRMPVYEERVDNIVGIVHAFDLLSSRRRVSHVGEIARSAPYVPGNQSAADLLVDLQATGNQMAVVVDEYGGAVGIVTVEDILEEIVGEIDDEYDRDPSPITAEHPGVWLVAAKTSVERINQELTIELPESDDYESIAGLVIGDYKRIPEIGESLVIGDIRVRITAASDRAVEQVEITRGWRHS